MARNSYGFSRFLAGLAVGSVIALLYAPKTGKDTRKKIRERADELYEDGKQKASEEKDRALELINTGKTAASQKAEELRSRIKQTKEKIAEKTERA